jgi:hypothetical protein
MSIKEEKESSKEAEDTLAVAETSNAKSISSDAVCVGARPKGSVSTIVDSEAAIALGVKGSALGY